MTAHADALLSEIYGIFEGTECVLCFLTLKSPEANYEENRTSYVMQVGLKYSCLERLYDENKFSLIIDESIDVSK